MVKGQLDVNGQKISTGDAIAFAEEKEVRIAASQDAEILLFDLN